MLQEMRLPKTFIFRHNELVSFDGFKEIRMRVRFTTSIAFFIKTCKFPRILAAGFSVRKINEITQTLGYGYGKHFNEAIYETNKKSVLHYFHAFYKLSILKYMHTLS